jgi:O-antigen/teichoic acid export membrane protein
MSPSTIAAPMPSAPRRARVLRGTVAYAAAAVLQRTIGFVLLPLYARVLTPPEYGQIGVLLTVTAAAGTVMALGLETAVFRTYSILRSEPAQRARFINTIGAFVAIVCAASAAFAALVLAPVISSALDVSSVAIGIGFVGAALTTASTVIPLAVLRAQERLRDYLWLTGVQVFLTVGLTLLFVVVLRLGVNGWMLAIAAAAAMLLVRGLLVLGHRWSVHFDTSQLAAALAFGIPMVPHALAHWGLALSDRVVLSVFLDSFHVGVYYIAYQFGLPISVLGIAMAQAAQPLFARASVSSDADHDLGRAVTLHATTVLVVGMSVAVLGKPAIVAFLPASYADAADLVAWIALGSTIFALYFIPMNAITILMGRNRWVWVITLTAAAANVALNLLLVPQIGVIAAALDTVIGYTVLLAGVSWYARRVLDRALPVEWSRIGLAAMLVTAGTAFAMLVNFESAVATLSVRAIVIVVVIGVFVALGLVRPSTLLRRTEPKNS